MSSADKLAQVWDPHRVSGGKVIEEGEILGPQEGKVVSIDAKGVYFTVDAYDKGRWRFGPAPYHGMGLATVGTTGAATAGTAHTHGETLLPAVGNHCLVVFVGAGLGNPRVVSWWA